MEDAEKKLAGRADTGAKEMPAAEDASFSKDRAGEGDLTGEVVAADRAGKPKPPRRKRSAKRIIFWCVCMLVVGVILFNILAGLFRSTAPVYVETQMVQTGNVHQVLSTTGIVTSGERVTVFGAVTAPVSGVFTEAGTYVTAGSDLFAYDTTDLERSYRQAAAARGIAGLQAQAAIDAGKDSEQAVTDTQASIDNLKIQLQKAQQAAAAIQLQYNEVEAQLTAAEVELEALQALPSLIPDQVTRMTELITTVIPGLEAQLKAISTQLAIAQEDVNYQAQLLAQMQTANAQAKAGVLDGNAQKQLQYQGVASQVAFEIAEANLKKGETGVQAPISGVVTSLSLEKGAISNQYAPMCVIESVAKVDVVISLSRYDLERVSVGQKATILLLGQEYSAMISKINRMATTSATTSYVAATVAVDNPGNNVFLGVEANVEIATGDVNNVLTIPISAVNTDVNGTYCFVYEDGVAHRREITVGMSSDQVVEIASGLGEGEEVILSSQNITDGMDVTKDASYSTADNGGALQFSVGQRSLWGWM